MLFVILVLAAILWTIIVLLLDYQLGEWDVVLPDWMVWSAIIIGAVLIGVLS